MDEVYSFGRDQLDITNEEQCWQVIDTLQPDVIVDCAAYTGVDAAESGTDQAYQMNAFGTRNLVVAAERVKAKFCYINILVLIMCSTEQRKCRIRSITIRTRRMFMGSRSGRANCWCIAFDAILFCSANFAAWSEICEKMLKLAREQDSLMVVYDQLGSPTYTVDLAQFLQQLLETERYGVYHAIENGNVFMV